jgi:hypothetical protein
MTPREPKEHATMTRLDRIKRAKSSRPKIVVLAGLLVFAAVGGAAWAAQSGEVKGPSVDRAKTLTFKPDADLDTAVNHTLFTIGKSTVFAACWRLPETDPSPEAGGIGVAVALRGGPDEAFLVTDLGALPSGPGPGPPGPQPFVEFAVGPGEVNGGVRSFAVFDGGGASASGTASFLVDEPNERCVATAQVAG